MDWESVSNGKIAATTPEIEIYIGFLIVQYLLDVSEHDHVRINDLLPGDWGH